MGHIAAAQKLQKIAVFLGKSLKIGGFEQFQPKSWDIYTRPHVCPNSRAKRRIGTYMRTELRIMRADSPARLVELLRRDVFALKICVHYACAALGTF